MRFDKKTGASSTEVTGPVTTANWLHRSIAFTKARGGEGFVIRPLGSRDGAATPAQWGAWLGYLSARGIPTVFMRSNQVATVPCEWPENFDFAAGASDRNASGIPEHTDRHREKMAARVSGMFDGLSSGLARPDPRRRSAAPPLAPVDHLARARQLEQEYAADPVGISAESLEKAFGV